MSVPLFQPVKFLGGGRILPMKDWQMPLHQHDFHEMIVVQAGRMFVTDGHGQTIAAGPGDVLFYPARVPHQERSDRDAPVETTFVSFRGEMNGGIAKRHDRSGRIRQLVGFLIDDYCMDRTPGFNDVALFYLRLIERKLSDHSPGAGETVVVLEARRFMLAHLHTKIQLADIARHCHLSKYHFSRLYKKAAGLPVMTDLKKMRLQRVLTLLQTTLLPLKALAAQTGFASEFHLSREIKREYGHSPSQSRR